MFAIVLNILVLILAVVSGISKYPFAVRLNIEFTNAPNTHICGGSIFSPSIVLTAAHCLYHEKERVTRVIVIAGKINYEAPSPTEQVVKVKGYKIHEDYKAVVQHLFSRNEYYLNDIAILWLKRRLVGTNAVKPAKVSAAEVTSEMVGIGLGFAPINSESAAKQLNAVTLKTISYNLCRKFMKIGLNTFCALPVENGSCRNTKGDSGSAFVYNNEVLGLISFQIVNKKGIACEDMPIVMTHIKKHAAMLAQSIKNGPPTNPCAKPKEKLCAL